MANLETYLSNTRKALDYQVLLRAGYGAFTLAADAQLTARSPHFLKLDPGGSARNVDLPGIVEGVADTDGLIFVIVNDADAAETITVRNPANGTVDTIAQNQMAIFMGTGAQAYVAIGVWTDV